MATLIVWLFGCAVSWILLIIAMLLARRIADVQFPPLGEFLWKAALLVVGVNAVVGGLSLVNWLLADIVGFILFVVLMMKLFDLDLLQTVIIIFAVWLVRVVLIAGLVGLAA